MARKPVNHYKAIDSIQRLAYTPIWLISFDMSFELSRRQIFISIHENSSANLAWQPLSRVTNHFLFSCANSWVKKSRKIWIVKPISPLSSLSCRYCGRQQSWNSQSLKSYHTQCYNHSLVKLFIIFSVCKQRFFLLLCFFSSQRR